VKVVDGAVILNDVVKVTTADIQASNGIIHVIDTVLIPPAPLPSIVDIAVGNPAFSTLVGALKAANLVDTLSGKGPFTVFAPTNDAFAKLSALPEGEALKKVLLYHVASGKLNAQTLIKAGMASTLEGSKINIKVVNGEVILNDVVKVVTADIEASNGIIHVIDTVLIPPAAPAPLKSIVEIATSDERFTTLVSALKSANLVETLSGHGPFTVFAPTNDAFAKLSSLPSGDALKNVLLFHVAKGKFDSNSFVKRPFVSMIQGGLISVVADNEGTLVISESSKIIIKDIQASNGIIHVIDTVLTPKK
jgi:transforming growth factor-beta-induced protein